MRKTRTQQSGSRPTQNRESLSRHLLVDAATARWLIAGTRWPTRPSILLLAQDLADPEKPNVDPRRFLACLDALCWSQRGVAALLGRDDRLIRRWAAGRAAVPADVAAWLETLTTWHEANPPPVAPRGRPGVGSGSGRGLRHPTCHPAPERRLAAADRSRTLRPPLPHCGQRDGFDVSDPGGDGDVCWLPVVPAVAAGFAGAPERDEDGGVAHTGSSGSIRHPIRRCSVLACQAR